MSIRFDKYNQIKDNLCIVYNGHCPEYLVMLKLVRPTIMKSLPGLTIYLCGQDHFMYLLNDVENVVPISRLDTRHEIFGYVKYVKPTMVSPHPIDVLLTESGIEMSIICKNAGSKSHLCYIFSKGELPTQNLTEQEIDKCKKLAIGKGYEVQLNPNHQQDVGWVIGVECLDLVDAASKGIKTSLIPTGIGEKVYHKMFPAMEMLYLN